MEEIEREDLRKTTEQAIRNMYYNISLVHTINAKKIHIKSIITTICMILSAMLCILFICLKIPDITAFEKGLSVAALFSFVTCTPFIFEVLRMNSDDDTYKYSEKFFGLVFISFVTASLIIDITGFLSIPILAVPLLFGTIKVDCIEKFGKEVGIAVICMDNAEKFCLTLEKLEELCNGGEYVAEYNLFKIKLQKMTQ